MRAYVIKEQTLADLLGAAPATTSSTRGSSTSGCRNSDPVADTQGAREVGCRFTREEWYSIWYFVTEQRQGRRTDNQLTREFTRFYNKFGPNSSYRLPHAYASALYNERINIGGNNSNWESIRQSLQRFLQQARAAEASAGSGEGSSEEELESIARMLIVATRGANWNEGDILIAIRYLRNQSDWDYVARRYPLLRTSRSSLASVLNSLNDDEKASIRRHFNSVNIDPGDEFEFTRETSLPEQLNAITTLVDGDKDQPLNNAQSREYVSSVLDAFIVYLNNQESGLGDKFDDFITNPDSVEGQRFRQFASDLVQRNSLTRARIDNALQRNLNLIWGRFLLWSEMGEGGKAQRLFDLIDGFTTPSQSNEIISVIRSISTAEEYERVDAEYRELSDGESILDAIDGEWLLNTNRITRHLESIGVL